MTLFAEVQGVLERTYRPAGVSLEACLVGPSRRRELAACAAGSGALVSSAQTFLRFQNGNLHLAIFYDPAVVDCLEREHPRRRLSHRNIGALIAFLEEVSHGLHAALAFRAGRRGLHREAFLCELEVQGKVDTYFLLLRFAALLAGSPVPEAVRDWLWDRVFGDERFDYDDPRLTRRYRLAHDVARQLVQSVMALEPRRRVRVLREFRRRTLSGKLRWVRSRGIACGNGGR